MSSPVCNWLSSTIISELQHGWISQDTVLLQYMMYKISIVFIFQTLNFHILTWRCNASYCLMTKDFKPLSNSLLLSMTPFCKYKSRTDQFFEIL